MNEWTKMNKKRPTEDTAYLVVEGNQVCILCWNGFHNCWDDEDGDDYHCDPSGVTDWMPLPMPPMRSERGAKQED